MLMSLIAILVIWGGPLKKYLVHICPTLLSLLYPSWYLGITQFMGSWSVIGAIIMIPGIEVTKVWSMHILHFLAATQTCWVYFYLSICNPKNGKDSSRVLNPWSASSFTTISIMYETNVCIWTRVICFIITIEHLVTLKKISTFFISIVRNLYTSSAYKATLLTQHVMGV